MIWARLAGVAAVAAVAVWVALPAGAPTTYVAPNGNDSGACSQTAPCRSFDVAAQGGTVHVAAGAYPQQDVKHSGSFVADGVVTVDCGSTSTVGGGTIGGQSCIDVYASHVSFDGGPNKLFRTKTYSVAGFSYQGRVDTERNLTDIQFRNMDVGAFAIGSDQTTIDSNDIGPSVDPLNNRCCGGSNVWSNNRIHDFRIKNGGHFECLTWDGGNATFQGNVWSGCDVFAIFAKPVDNISGSINDTFTADAGTNQDVKITLGSGATRCDVQAPASTPNGVFYDCPGVTTSGNPPPTTTTVPTTTAVTTTTVPACPLEDIYRQALTDLRASTLYGQYRKANPKEAARVDVWLSSPSSTEPAVNTATGRFLVGVGGLYLTGCD